MDDTLTSFLMWGIGSNLFLGNELAVSSRFT
jgi:hypothetical protein